MLSRFLIAFVLIAVTHSSFTQSFQKILPETRFGNFMGYLVMADLNNDGNLDLIGTDNNSLKTFFNNGDGTFQTPVYYTEWRGESQIQTHTLDAGDIDQDGFLDILQTGGPNYPVFHVLINTNPGFKNIAASSFPKVTGTSYLNDFDADGDLDILYSGNSYASGGIFLNRGDKFISGPGLVKQNAWYATWFNLDQDSELEVLTSVGQSNYLIGNFLLDNLYPKLRLTQKLVPQQVFIYNVSFADFDSDGDLDILARESDGNRIYKNENGDFISTSIKFPASKTADFGDVNNDGLYDVVISGMMTSVWQVFETGIYLNQGNGSFTKLTTNIPSFEGSSASLADVDGDGDLDIPTQAGVFRNLSSNSNNKPSPPITARTQVSGSSVVFQWQASTDDKTPVNGLTYNIHVRNAADKIVLPGHSLSSGQRQLAKPGNASNHLSFQLSCLKEGTYYWKVQAIDASYLGSAFSSEQSFTITKTPPASPTNLTATSVTDRSIQLKWTPASQTEDVYIILRKPQGSEWMSPIDTIQANQYIYLDTLYLNADTHYDYEVIASNCAYPDQYRSSTSGKTFPRAFVDSKWLTFGRVTGTMVRLADADNDRDLDLLLTYSGANTTQLYYFTNNTYADSGISFPVSADDAHWIDYNNDGYLDILFIVSDYTFTGKLRLFKSMEGKSYEEDVSNTPIISNLKWQCGISMGDYDRDGDEDMLVQANGIQLLENDGKGKFSLTSLSLQGHIKSSGAWADFDRDGDLDILATKKVNNTCASYHVVVYQNNGDKSFTAIEYPTLQSTNDDFFNLSGQTEWGDIDNDGYPDILISGMINCGNGEGMNRIYRNNGNNTFTKAADLRSLIYDSQVAFGDYDNDGDADVFSYGDSRGAGMTYTRIFENNAGVFKDVKNINYLLSSTQHGKATRGDIDHDGDLDYIILGEIDYVSERIIAYQNMYANAWGIINQQPNSPATPKSNVGADGLVTLSWQNAIDKETPSEGLSYNYYLIHESGRTITNSNSLFDGSRKLVMPGNAQSVLSIVLKGLPAGTYRWAVQSIDASYTGSEFSAEQIFTITTPPASPVTGLDETYPIEIYPNPVGNFINIKTQDIIKLIFVNTSGQRVLTLEADPQNQTANISMLTPGLYFVIVYKDGTKVANRKIMKW